MKKLIAQTALAGAAFLPVPCLAAEWPHWRGPERNGITSESSGWDELGGLPSKPQWRAMVGEGSSSPIVHDGKVFCIGWEAGKDVVRCLDAGTGKEMWRQEYPSPPYGRHAVGDQGFYRGATATPEFDPETGMLYTLGCEILAERRGVFRNMAWPHVVGAGGRIFCKTRAGELACFGLSGRGPAVVADAGGEAEGEFRPGNFGGWPGSDADPLIAWKQGAGVGGCVGKARRVRLEARGKAVHLVVTYRSGETVTYVNGKEVSRSNKVRGDFSNWEGGQELILGDEWSGGSRDWAGRVFAFAIYQKVLGEDEVRDRFGLAGEGFGVRRHDAAFWVTLSYSTFSPEATCRLRRTGFVLPAQPPKRRPSFAKATAGQACRRTPIMRAQQHVF